jgi:GntR family histidine utilization transcriptional repressor
VRNKPYNRCDLRFFARNASETDARVLGTTVGEALFVIDRTTWTGRDPITTVMAISAPGYELLTQI